MKFKEFFKNLFLGIKDGVSRFLVAFICSALFFLTVAYEIIFEAGSDEVIIPLLMSLALTAIFSVLLKVIKEYMTETLLPVIQYVLCGITAIATFLLLNANYESLYAIMAYTGIMIALICFIFFVLMRGEGRDLAFPRVVSSLVFSEAVCAVLSVGLSLCIAAFDMLIFHYSDSYKIYALVNCFIWIVVFVNVFLSFIPKKDTPAPQSKIFRTLVLFAGLPLYILLIAILLVYLAKIVITMHMPVGEINWFASFASLFFIFFLLSVRQYSEKLAVLFTKYGGYFLVPVLVMQAIAVFERINAYGLTTPRTISLVLIIISVLFIGGGTLAPKHLDKIALVSGLIVLIVTVTPLNVIDMPVASQTGILERVLSKNDMLVDGEVVPSGSVSREDAERITSAYQYLKYNAERVPDFIPDPKKDFEDIFGFTRSYTSGEAYEYKYVSFTTKNPADITEYDEMIKISAYNSPETISYDGEQYTIDVKQLATELYNQYGEDKHDIDIYVLNENVGLYFDHFGIDIRNDEISYYSFEGYALLKD